MNSSFSNYKFRKFFDSLINFIIAAVCIYSVALMLLPSLFYTYEFLWNDYQSKSKILFASFIALNIVKYLNHLTINSERDRELFKRTLLYSTFALLFFVEGLIADGFKIFIYIFTMGLLALLGLREIFNVLVSLDKRYTRILNRNFSAIQIFVLSFAVTIVVGTLLLMTPKASVHDLSFLDAFFMAVSATCVTGLTVISTEHDLTQLGQFIILLLFQIGGLGTMTFAIGLSGIFSESLSFNDKVLISKALNFRNLTNIKTVLIKTFIFTFSIESLGVLYFFFSIPTIEGQSLIDRFFYSVFHTISAFCNAGFSLSDSSVSSGVWNSSVSLLGVTGFLIVLGGLGFPVLINIYTFIKKREKLTLHSKVVLLYSSVFLVIGSLGVYLLEFDNYFKNGDEYFSVLNSIFTSITSRTAGFNSLDIGALNDSTLFLICGLMFIGGAPMSTAGGLKVTTFAVAFSHLYARVRKFKDPVLFEKSLSKKNVADSLNTISLSLFAVFFAIFFMSIMESDKEFISVFFEAFSALATVGLSTGITSDLSSFSKLTLCILMFLGRVNILIFLDAVIRNSKKTRLQYLEEEIVL